MSQINYIFYKYLILISFSAFVETIAIFTI